VLYARTHALAAQTLYLLMEAGEPADRPVVDALFRARREDPAAERTRPRDSWATRPRVRPLLRPP